MGVIKSPLEFKVNISAARIFQTLIIESYTLLPHMMPTAIKSYDLIHGDGGAGSISLTTFHEGAPFPYVKHRIDVVDTENFMIRYALIEGALLGDKLESIHYLKIRLMEGALSR
ncbi:major allergen Pru ar 1-like [Olea europaea subsp. europaea]|uniref:Major allergen Pru ar 1-like n=1 Tax=Olea europaea subsp. europaea TaxID=158383 RepID=A0A8S0SN49_OLEEU|nr:major allergen Pru ar 1-like [Olea europaea subsp. europaea]